MSGSNNAVSVWKNIIDELLVKYSDSAIFKTLFSNTKIKNIDSKYIIISCNNVFTIENIKKKFEAEILDIIQSINPDITKIDYEVDSFAHTIIKTGTKRFNSQNQKKKIVEEKENFQYQPTTDNYDFKNFIVGSSNKLAFAASQFVVEKPGSHYNPLFIYGPPGTGKTHLLWSIRLALEKKINKLKSVYATSEEFTNDFIRSVQEGEAKNFSNKYRNVDLLLIDDLQFIAKKEKTQEEFFHTFNTLHQAGKQIVLCADRPPKQIETIDQRLTSRFEWGMVVDVGLPDLETRVAILIHKAFSRKVFLPLEIANYIAEKLDGNIRELEGFLNKIIVQSTLKGNMIEMEIVEKELDTLGLNNNKIIKPNQVIESVANIYGVAIDDILSSKRDQYIVKPRQVIMYILRKRLDLSQVQIAKILGGKDHTTVIYALKKVEEKMKKDKTFKEDLEEILAQIFKN